jgi:predicted transcriptional regulator
MSKSPLHIEKNMLLELEILKHVESTPLLNTRMAASKLGCSVKLAHALLGKMVVKGLLHVKKIHSRRWDYFLTPKGVSEKIRLTYDFLDFSLHFYQEARKASSEICRKLFKSGKVKVAFLGAGELAEIAYLGVKEWNLELIELFDVNADRKFLGHQVLGIEKLSESEADAVIVCMYDKKRPMESKYLPKNIEQKENMYWIFDLAKG